VRQTKRGDFDVADFALFVLECEGVELFHIWGKYSGRGKGAQGKKLFPENFYHQLIDSVNHLFDGRVESVKCELDLTVDFVRCVLHICGKYIKKEDGRKERKQFCKDLFSRIARGWHGKC